VVRGSPTPGDFQPLTPGVTGLPQPPLLLGGAAAQVGFEGQVLELPVDSGGRINEQHKELIAKADNGCKPNDRGSDEAAHFTLSMKSTIL
jgi:hypothetical protein